MGDGGETRHLCTRLAGHRQERSEVDHPDQQRRRQRPPHRSGHQQGRRRDRGIEAGHGAGTAPDGSRIYVSDEAESTLDIVDAKTLKVTKKVPSAVIPTTWRSARTDGRVYVGIIQAPGGVDVIDTASMQRVKTVPTKGTIHNAYVTPDWK